MTRKQKLINFILINLVLILMPAADIFFLVPSRVAAGGFYGIGVIIMHILGIDAPEGFVMAVIAGILTIPLLIYSYLYFARDYFNKSAYCTIGLIFTTALFALLVEYFGVPTTEFNLLTSTFMGSLIQAVGIGVIMGLGGSTGGTDIVAKIINKYYPAISIGTGVTIGNGIIVLISALVLGVDRAIAAIAAIVITGLFIDGTLKLLFGVTSKDLE